jgi:hypothetical protein
MVSAFVALLSEQGFGLQGLLLFFGEADGQGVLSVLSRSVSFQWSCSALSLLFCLPRGSVCLGCQFAAPFCSRSGVSWLMLSD